MSTETQTTPAQEMRTAAARLRCKHSHPVQPPHGLLWAPGPCEGCGVAYGAAEDISEPIREALADLLDEVARQYEEAPCDKPDGACNGCERRDDFVYAHNLAQLINGTQGGA